MNRRNLCVAVYAAIVATSCTSDSPPDVVGLLESDRVELAVEFAEPVRARHLLEGDTANAGQLLLTQDDNRLQIALRSASARVAETEARLAELLRGPRPEQIRAARADVNGARDALDFQRIELQRAQEIFDRQLAAKETVDRAQVAVDAATARLLASEARLEELLAGTTVEELRQVEQQLEQRRSELAAAQVDLERLKLYAPADGIVDTFLLEAGELPRQGTTAVVMLTGIQPYARVYIPESQRVQVTPGTPAIVRVDGLENPLEGRVRWVSSDAAFTPYFALTEHDRGRLTYAAKIDIDYNGPRLPDGVPVQVQFGATTAQQ